MSDIIPFEFPATGQQIRTVPVDGEPWFVAADVCVVLGYSRIADALRIPDEDDLGTHFVRGAGGKDRSAQIISEPGLYSLILRSSRPEAKAFKRWITHEVLPSIRKTGSYSVARAPGDDLDVLQSMVAAMRADRQRIAAIEAKVEAIEGRHDWFAALAWAKLHDHPTNRPFLAKAGRRATAIMRAQGRQPDHRQDATFGRINVYPADVLEQAFNEVVSA